MISSLTDIPAVAKYLRRIGAEPRSLRNAVVKEHRGQYWREIAVIKFNEDGDVVCPDEFAPTPSEATAIKEECKLVDWPTSQKLSRLRDLPDRLKNADPNDIYEIRDEDGQIVFVQLRGDPAIDKFKYIPWSFWSDGKWRMMEPDGYLPLYGIQNVKKNDATTVFIHEGAKAARHAHWITSAETADARKALAECPWGEDMLAATHLGWVGGAMSPHRTDWSSLKRLGVNRAYIVSDNDYTGKAAVPVIARQLRMPTFHVQFTNEWPDAFDMADKWPEKMFKTIEAKRHYVGPTFRECLHPATWATDLRANKKGKPTKVLRDHFKDMWAYIEDADMFVCTEMPDIVRTEKIFNNMMSSFSHAQETSKLLLQSFNGRTTRICYRPDINGRIVTNKGTSSINLHVESPVKPVMGNAKPWLEFMEYLFPKEEERVEMLRWCATLIAHPEVRMEYGVLLVSESQGVGKTTLGASILAPLVGYNNVSFPGESDIVNTEFNGWIAHKRLAVINEIYSGHSWKAYNRLKSLITDKDIRMNEKFQKPYNIENWCHILACSNSLRALKIEDDDRRWFYPEVTENRWPRSKFADLHVWLASGGLGIIKHWAIRQDVWVLPGERAPMTGRKTDLIEGSMSDAQKEVADLAHAMSKMDMPVAVAMKDIEQWVKQAVHGHVHDSDYDLRKVMKTAQVLPYKTRIFVGGRLQYVMLNSALKDAVVRLNGAGDDEIRTVIVKAVKSANEILPVVM